MSDALFDVPQPERPVGAAERTTVRCLELVGLDPVFDAAAEVLRIQAAAVDTAHATGKPYPVSHSVPVWQALAEPLGLVPAVSREVPDDGLDVWLRQLTAPTMGDPAQP